MDTVFTLVLCFVIWASIHVLTSKLRRSGRLPPGPFPLPIIGNIHQLGQNPNQSMAKLAKIYGPIMSLRLGSRFTVVVSSPSMAREVLQRNDQMLASRTIANAVQAHDHFRVSVAWLSPSPQWRNLRKISKERMFTLQTLDAGEGLRQKKIQELCDYMRSCSVRGEAANIGEAAFTTTLNLITTTLFSVDFAAYNSNISQELKEIVTGVTELAGTPNLADYFPVLKFFDPQGILKQSRYYFGRLLDTFDNYISEREALRASSGANYARKSDMLEALLDYREKNESELSRKDMKHLLLDLLVAGSDTTSVTVHWAISQLLRNPDKRAKVRAELEEVIGKNEEVVVKESDISRLPYLQAVIKETFRLHPADPLLVPHKAEEEVEINGYIVPKDSNILVNVWASGRDSETWSDPDAFIPERFLGSGIDTRGQHFQLIPFGSGRRMCPGQPLAHRMVHLMVAALIRNFEWKLVDEGMKPEDIDMEEKFGLATQKAVPLVAVPIKI